MLKIKKTPMKYKSANGSMQDVGAIMGSEVTDITLSKSGVAADAKEVGNRLGNLSQEIVDLKENGTSDKKAVVENAVGTTYPPSQKPASTDFSGYDIDIYSCMSDDVFSYIDEIVSGKETVTKEILGKDGSGKYDIARYIYANREYIAWQRENYPKMYAWKNGNVVKYTTSVSPRINDKAYDYPYVQDKGTQVITVPAKAAVLVGKRYSLSGGGFKDNAGTSAIVLPLPKEITGSIVITLENMKINSSYGNVYGGTTNNTFTGTVNATSPSVSGYTSTTLRNTDYEPELLTAVSKYSFVTFFVNSTGVDGQYNNSKIFVDGVEVAFEITTDPTIATQENTTTTETDEGGTPITAVSSANRSRTIGGVAYVRYEKGDVEPTVVYTDIDDDRNNGTSIIKDNVVYNRYPLGDLGANRKKLIPVFVYANEHGNPKEINYAPPSGSGHEGTMPALIASRFLRDLSEGKQKNNPFYNYLRENCMVIVIPVANPFGFNLHISGDTPAYSWSADGYYNYNGCNINRNYDTPGWDVMLINGESSVIMGTYAGSQNETQYIMNTMVESGAVVAMSLHGMWGWQGYVAHQGQNPNPNATGENDKYVDYNQEKLAKVSEFLQENWGYTLRYYDMSNGEPVRCKNTPDVTSKSPSYISQCGAYGGIVEFTEDDIRTSEFKIEHNGYPNENAYAQMLNLMAMWLSDYLESI